MHRRPALLILLLMLAGCATAKSPSGTTRYYVSWGGAQALTGPLADQTEARMRDEPGFVRGFEDPLNVRVRDGVEGKAGGRFEVEIKTDPIVAGRLIRPRDRVLAHFYVTCTPDRWDPCVDRIVAGAHHEAARLPRIVARSPVSTAADREALQAGKVVGAKPKGAE